MANKAADVATAVATINANGLKAGDTANIWIVQDIDTVQALSADTKKSKHNVANWGTVPAHTAKICVNGYSGNTFNTSDSAKVQIAYIATGPQIGDQGRMHISGPTEFGNVCILYTSKSNINNTSGKTHINIGGNNVVFGKDTKYAYIPQDEMALTTTAYQLQEQAITLKSVNPITQWYGMNQYVLSLTE